MKGKEEEGKILKKKKEAERKQVQNTERKDTDHSIIFLS
jgi:hypothetical protein